MPLPRDKAAAAAADNDYLNARRYLDGLFSTSDPAAACLSIVPHSLKDAQDLRSHVFGCLGYDERVRALDNLDHAVWHDMERLDSGSTYPSPVAEPDRLTDRLRYTRYLAALSLQAELKRIDVLRETPALKELARDLRDSVRLWRDENADMIQDVHDCRIDWHIFGPKRSVGPESHTDSPSCTKRDKGLCEFSQKLRQIVEAGRDRATQPSEDYERDYSLKRDIKARLIKLRRSPEATKDGDDGGAKVATDMLMGPDNERVDDEIFKGTFPDQQVSVHWLLHEKFQRCDTKQRPWPEKFIAPEMRYFHIPANNMSWVEEAIASYFKEPITDTGDGAKLGPRARLVLNDWCWKGQEHGVGPGSIVHNRYLRPTCEKISTEENDAHNIQKGLVLFMPFLHWETDRRRNQAANLIEQLTDEHDLDKRETAKIWRMRRQEDRESLPRPGNLACTDALDYQEPDYYESHSRDVDKIFYELARLLWKRLYRSSETDKDVPLSLPHVLRQKVRYEEHDNELLVALRKVIDEMRVSGDPLPDSLKSLLLEREGDDYRFRAWKDMVWQLKAAGRGCRTPHALEDIFWEVIKRTRKRADAETGTFPGSFRSRNIFQSPTTIFRGVATDEHGVLQPRTRLAQIFVKAARLCEQMATYPDRQILEEYLFKDPALHPRRTLDQAYFWRLRNTRLRDRDQVVYRYTNGETAHKYRPQPPVDLKDGRSIRSLNSRQANHFRHLPPEGAEERWAWKRHGHFEENNGCDQCSEDIKKTSKVIMVDQLWMWILDQNTILTCFPQRYGTSDNDPFGVHQAIRTRMKDRSDPDNQIRSVFDIALIIVDECFSTLFHRAETADARPQVLDVFAESIGHVRNKQSVAFQHLWSLTERQAYSEEYVDSSLLSALLNVSLEADLQREIRDIIDELDIILHIAHQQSDMIARVKNLAEQILDSNICHLQSQSMASSSSKSDNEKARVAWANKEAILIVTRQKREFEAKSEVLLCEVADRIKEIGGLKKSAESTAQNVNDLLALKQQQAGIVQAYEAMKQGEETVRQGKAIMVFTVMTIIFLPLSFMSSIFGMNNVEESGDSDSSGPVADQIVSFWPTTFKRQIVVMFTVSFGAVLVVLIPAFSPFIRAVVHSALSRFFTKAITWTSAYQTWLETGWDSKQIRDKAKSDVRKMREGVKEQMRAKRLKQSEIGDGVRSADGKLRSTASRRRPTSPAVLPGISPTASRISQGPPRSSQASFRSPQMSPRVSRS